MSSDDDALVLAIRGGQVEELARLLARDPKLATARVVAADGSERSLLHIATDWPGHFPRVAETIATLVRAGANVDAPFIGPHAETPLHWAASSNDIEALDALLAHGATIDRDGAVIGGGTALDDAVAFGQEKAARRLCGAGARVSLWNAAALGMVERVEHVLATGAPTPAEITHAFWWACHGGQAATAELLARHGADVDALGHDDLTPLAVAERSGAADLVRWLRARSSRQ